MLRNDCDSIAKRYVIGSIILHALVFACSSISFFQPKKSDLLLVDIELAGEGELQEALNQPQEQPIPEEIPPEKILEDEKSEEQQQENAEPDEKVEEPGADEEINPVQENMDEKIENSQEEPVPNTNEASPEDESIVKEKKPIVKKRDKRALMDVIRKAEKKKARDEARKKLLEIVSDTTKRKRNEDFDKMLDKSIQNMKKKAGNGKRGNGRGRGSGIGLSEGDYEMISSQIYPHWVVPSGIRDAENIIIEMRVQIKDNGQVIPSSVKILDERRYATDYIFRAAADSARRAILDASPLKIPRDKIDLFRDFILRFNLKEALGG
ncbi:MAG: hypothetical protein LBP41_02150 [Holosporaceae bacterium]|jgi:hypothetical protein|nr:hypothetical protein [Holosporaceae bacterium]